MSVKQTPLRLGTRGSPLALKQADIVCRALASAHPGLRTDIIVIRTSGDWRPADGEVRLEEDQGGKALFAKEIEEALLAGHIDAGIHSMKDMQSFLPQNLVIDHMLPRADARDALIANDGGVRSIYDLPQNAKIGTCALRRQAFLLARRPDLQIEILRGNVQTRLDKLKSGQVDATLLAYAGLQRLGLEQNISALLSLNDMVPAAGQGAVGIERRQEDEAIARIFDAINCRETLLCVKAERAALASLNGGCHTPVGVHASLTETELHIRIALGTPDGRYIFTDEIKQTALTIKDAEQIGHALGQNMKETVPPEILEKIL